LAVIEVAVEIVILLDVMGGVDVKTIVQSRSFCSLLSSDMTSSVLDGRVVVLAPRFSSVPRASKRETSASKRSCQ
jgi:hypothetical protein